MSDINLQTKIFQAKLIELINNSGLPLVNTTMAVQNMSLQLEAALNQIVEKEKQAAIEKESEEQIAVRTFKSSVLEQNLANSGLMPSQLE